MDIIKLYKNTGFLLDCTEVFKKYHYNITICLFYVAKSSKFPITCPSTVFTFPLEKYELSLKYSLLPFLQKHFTYSIALFLNKPKIFILPNTFSSMNH